MACAQKYWGGGSAFLATSAQDWRHLSPGSAAFEDGTLSFLDIAALQHGASSSSSSSPPSEPASQPPDRPAARLRAHRARSGRPAPHVSTLLLPSRAGLNVTESLGGMAAVEDHVDCIADWLAPRLADLKHSNGNSMLKIFGKHNEPFRFVPPPPPAAHGAGLDAADHSASRQRPAASTLLAHAAARPCRREVQGGTVNFEVLTPDGSVSCLFARVLACGREHGPRQRHCPPLDLSAMRPATLLLPGSTRSSFHTRRWLPSSRPAGFMSARAACAIRGRATAQ